ncbi:hypothetical protein [Shewanella acanthi]|uniref:hypothetical protein n=1 Tax=Shewanella acanthi TaxID=2864212 RepID=UPI001C6612BB|nr:hypothetical protein [Shewanella acanthi]QYJ78575.1 hypothetical protein K0H61_16045 [Shewanella acanthi]
MLLKSLFCLHGRDSRSRFIAISVGVYLSIGLAAAAFGANFLLFLCALLGAPLLTLSALRRLSDANKPKVLVAALVLPLVLILALLVVGAPPIISALGFILAMGATFWGWRFASPTLVDYQFGYYGPALNAPVSQTVPRRRVEPVIASKMAAKDDASTVVAVPSQDAEVLPVMGSFEPEKAAELTAELSPADKKNEARAEPVFASANDAKLAALREDELRFDELTRLTQNPAAFVVEDALLEPQADFRQAHISRVEETRIEIAEVDLDKVDLEAANFRRAPLDPAEQSDEPVWRIDAEVEPSEFTAGEQAEDMRRRREVAKESGSMTELFRGLLEFIAPYRRYFKLPKIPALPKRLWRPVSAAFGAMLVVVLVWGLWPEGSDDVAPTIAAVPVAPESSGNRVTIEMPDGFSVALEQDVLILRWLGERGKVKNLWSIATAKGDSSCGALVFNNGTTYRTVTVDLHSDSATEARFSPLDTADIITDLARRGSIGLCGYKFSLKGSQAVLEPNRAFGRYLAR